MENSEVTPVNVSKPCVRVRVGDTCLSSMAVEWLQGKTSSFCVKDRDRRGKRSSSKLLISDRESSLSCDSISVE